MKSPPPGLMHLLHASQQEVGAWLKVEAPITDHLREFALDLEKYKVVQFFPM